MRGAPWQWLVRVLTDTSSATFRLVYVCLSVCMRIYPFSYLCCHHHYHRLLLFIWLEYTLSFVPLLCFTAYPNITSVFIAQLKVSSDNKSQIPLSWWRQVVSKRENLASVRCDDVMCTSAPRLRVISLSISSTAPAIRYAYMMAHKNGTQFTRWYTINTCRLWDSVKPLICSLAYTGRSKK